MPVILRAALVGVLALTPPAIATVQGTDCACLVNGGEAGPADCACDVGVCFARCVEDLCPSFPQCMLNCSRRCFCAANIALGCPDHVDPGPTPTPAPVCPGDCDGDGRVTVEELIRGVHSVLDGLPTSTCPHLDWDRDDEVTVHELVKAVNTALCGCIRRTG